MSFQKYFNKPKFMINWDITCHEDIFAVSSSDILLYIIWLQEDTSSNDTLFIYNAHFALQAESDEQQIYKILDG